MDGGNIETISCNYMYVDQKYIGEQQNSSKTLQNDLPICSQIFSEESSGFDALRLPHSIHSPDRYSCTEPDKPFSHCVTHRGDQSRQHRLPWSVEDLCQENYTELGMRVSGDIL